MREHNFGDGFDLRPTLPAVYEDLLVTVGTPLQLNRGELLYRQGETASHVYLLRSGHVKSCAVSMEGHETLLRVHLPGSLLGLTALGHAAVRDASAVALDESLSIAVSREHILQLLRDDPAFAMHVVQLLVDRITGIQSRMHEVFCSTVEQRVARTLLALAEHEADVGLESHIGIALSHEELSHIVGARRQTVTQVLNRMGHAELIRVGRRRIYLLDPERLTRLLPH